MFDLKRIERRFDAFNFVGVTRAGGAINLGVASFYEIKIKNMKTLQSAFCLIVALTLTYSASAQDYKRPLEHTDYEKWNTISGQSLSRDGNWIMYTIRDGKDKSTLHLRHASSAKQYEIANGNGARFSFVSKYAMFRVSPDSDLVKKLKKEKRPAEEMPQTKFQILELESGDLSTEERIQSFAMPEENAEWMAIHLQKPFDQKTVKESKSAINESFNITEEGLERPYQPKTYKKPEPKKPAASEEKKTDKKPGDKKEEKKNKSDKDKQAGNVLIVRNLATGAEQRIPHVARFRFSKTGKHLAYVTSTGKDGEGDAVTVIDLAKNKSTNIIEGLGNYRNLTFSESEDHLAFLTDRDDYDSKHSSQSIYHWKSGQKEAKEVAGPETEGIPEGWWIASSGLSFSEDLKRLYFNTMPIPEFDDDEDDEKDPVAKLDLWHWKDPQLQPQQLLQAAAERNRSYRATYDLKSKKVVQLANFEMPSVSFDPRSTADMGLAVTNMRYRKQMSWDYPGFQDTYLVNLKSGEATLLLEAQRSGGSLSPDAKYVTWWDSEKQAYFTVSTKKGSEPVELSKGIESSLADELHDTPSPVRPYGSAGWTTDAKSMLIYDRFDIWQVDPEGKEQPVCITNGFGRENNIRFRYVSTDPEARFVDMNQTMLLSAFNEKTKESGCFELSSAAGDSENDDATFELTKKMMLHESIGRISKARDSDNILFTRSSYTQFPDLWLSSLDFKKVTRISDANPQQEEFNWGSVELVNWDATDGQKLDGLLYKPDNFDPSKKYPLLVYFYERNSDNLHRHWAPAAGRSIINFTFYVSRGYVVFVPDIPYKTGEPGPSAANAVLPGVESIVEMGFVDEAKIGMQGHSWGGYQTAYLVTQTDMFACAESGAPVSNMTSAYGGIRWGSGMSRMFQYERTQSRIGEDLWSARDKYLANSPVFFADKINTPLLILHNDEDGAVPWYQGIELFVAMRRLEKPCWLMNYNGEPHWVMKKENRMDFAIRMQQFFDHYLKDEPMPEWMANGIPAVDKGKTMGYEAAEMEEKAETESAAETTEEN